jgi:hypothetical protein
MFRTRTSMDAMIAGDQGDGPVLAGLIYHMSRCGSTLVGQMLRVAPATAVLSEPEPLDATIRWAVESGVPLDLQVAAVRATAHALGRGQPGVTRRYFIKLESWHAAALPLLRAAFPEVPWLFIYRDPVEVLVSQMRLRGLHTVAGLLPPAIIDLPGAEAMDETRYAALAIAHFVQPVLDHWSIGGGLLADYRELPEAVTNRIAPHFGLAPDAATLTAMAAAARCNAKSPEQAFTPDSADKRREAAPGLQAIADEILTPVIARLDRLRALPPAVSAKTSGSAT